MQKEKLMMIMLSMGGMSFMQMKDLQAQSMDRYVVSSAGSNISADNYSISFPIGEPVAEACVNGGQLSQGFHQEWAIVTAVDDPMVQLLEAKVYPNPTAGILQVETEESGNALLMDAQGHMIRRIKLEEGKNELNMTDISTGIYFLQLQSADELKMQSFKIHKVE